MAFDPDFFVSRKDQGAVRAKQSLQTRESLIKYHQLREHQSRNTGGMIRHFDAVQTLRRCFEMPAHIVSHENYQYVMELMATAFTEAADDVNTPDAVDPDEARADLEARRIFLALADAAMEQAASPPAEG